MNYVLLQCVMDSKLKVKMISSFPYIRGINCQFPTTIRQLGMYYVVESQNIKLVQRGIKPFYSMLKKEHIVKMTFEFTEIQEYLKTNICQTNIIKIFGDDDSNKCVICMTDDKSIVFAMCGHYSTCESCSMQLSKCPICRAPIVARYNRSQLI